jgi:toxin FitB
VSYLLDTNVISEWTKPRPDPGVVAFLWQEDEGMFFSASSYWRKSGRGIDRLAQGQRRTKLDEWLREDLVARFGGRLLSIDATIADMGGHFVSRRERAGRPLGAMDGWIAATAEVHGLTLATRNVVDFAGTVRDVIDPWGRV